MASRVLKRVLEGQSLESALQRYRGTEFRAEIFNVCYQCMRHYFSLAERLQSMLNRPRDRLDLEVWCVLLAGACQLEYSRTPPHAVVSNAVDATRKVGKSSASSLVNAVLRNYKTDSELKSIEAKYELPQWLLDSIESHYPDVAAELANALMSRAPLTLRVNSHRLSLEDFCSLLDEAGIEHFLPATPNSVTLDEPRSMSSIPGYDEGYFAVQDLSSQLAVPLLEPNSSDRILDACSAPGVKTAQIVDLYPDNCVVSVDVKPQCSTWNMLPKPQLRPRLETVQGDLRTTGWWDNVPYQRILLDAPCSGTGTIRRHPDLKVVRQHSDVLELKELQGNLLASVWGTLANEGLLVYSTCSFLPEENDETIERFVSTQSDAFIDRFCLPYGASTNFGWQILPTRAGGDGFYYARLRKSEEASCT
ncbi:MAG: 16S rRNA (cytosine(967)-C(5))-methyltransferase RsmB [Gammaproteobacteria bacterium]|nr:16S rRNA (cytosine(967)-C(5))-methyltransferase RsmB [Gammaproteobacteria bacterium]